MKQPINTYLSVLIVLLAGQAAGAQGVAVFDPPGNKTAPTFAVTTGTSVTRPHTDAVSPAQANLPILKVGGHKPKIKLKIYKKPRVKRQYYHPAYKHYKHRAPKPHLKHRGYRAPYYRYAPKRYRRY